MRSAATALVLLLSSGCGVTVRAGRPPVSPPRALTIEEEVMTRCMRSPSGAGHTYREPLPGPVTDPELRRALDRFPPTVRRTAVAAGIAPLLARLLRERERADGAPTPEQLELRLELAERIASLPGQLLATEFECECVITAIDEALRAGEESEAARELHLTIVTLVAGAAFGLVSGVWDLANSHARDPDFPDGPIVTSIAGAVATTGLGVAMLVPRPRPIVFSHEHNLLAPIVRGEDPELLFPTFVFRLLTMPHEGREPTPRAELLASWRARLASTVEPAERSLAERIQYGRGGVYDPALLELRRAFFAELEAALDMQSRYVDELSQAVRRALGDAAGPHHPVGEAPEPADGNAPPP